MSDTDAEKTESAKPSRLSGFIAPKGQAARPVEEEVQTQPVAPAPIVPEPEADPVPTPRPSMGVKSLTLRLPEDEYQRLRTYAFKSNTTHQEVLAKALHAYLKRAKA